MLKRFFSRLLASFMGAWLALVLFVVVVIIVFFSIFASIGSKKAEKIVADSILRLELNSPIVETEPVFGFDYSSILNQGEESAQVLRELTQGLAEGAANKDIKALYIHCEGVEAAPATLHALRDAVKEFKKSKKKVIAYGDSFSQADYYIASLADEIYLNPMGSVALTGISGTTMYFKKLLDKLGVKMQVFKVGTYKSAVEPFTVEEMSEPARAQLDTLYNSMWGVISSEIAASRKMKPETINALVNNVIMFRDAQTALKSKLVDKLTTRREIDEILADIADCDIEEINFVRPQLLFAQSDILSIGSGKNRIAVVYAEGEIAEDSKKGIDCARLVPDILELADDDDVKGMVLRVNSPGGSVFGSAEIADALAYFQQQGKPLVVSMGDYAASGGYWISCHADKIIADPLTITGSIGVFGMIPDASGLLNQIGINTSTVSTNPQSALPTLFTPLTEAETAAMQTNIEHIYDMFIKRVATGRKLSEDKVRLIAEGRVWSAVTAKKIGLVDELGGLDTAIETVAKLAKIDGNYRLEYYPDNNFSLLETLSELDGNQFKAIYGILGQTATVQTADEVLGILNRSHELSLMPMIKFNY